MELNVNNGRETPQAPSASDVSSTRRVPRVLVVEDEQDIAGLIKHALERSGDAHGRRARDRQRPRRRAAAAAGRGRRGARMSGAALPVYTVFPSAFSFGNRCSANCLLTTMGPV